VNVQLGYYVVGTACRRVSMNLAWLFLGMDSA